MMNSRIGVFQMPLPRFGIDYIIGGDVYGGSSGGPAADGTIPKKEVDAFVQTLEGVTEIKWKKGFPMGDHVVIKTNKTGPNVEMSYNPNDGIYKNRA